MSDPEDAAALLRLLREKSVDLCLLAYWPDPEEATIRANVFQRLRHVRLLTKYRVPPEDRAHQATLSQLAWLREEWPAAYAATEKLYIARHHWSGLSPVERLTLARWPEELGQEEQDILSLQVHGSIDLLQFKIERAKALKDNDIGVKFRRRPVVAHLPTEIMIGGVAGLGRVYLGLADEALGARFGS